MSISDWLDLDLCVRVVQTLAHFLWQGLLIAAIVAGLNWLARTRSATTRYAVGCIALLLMVVCLPITFVALRTCDDQLAATRESRVESEQRVAASHLAVGPDVSGTQFSAGTDSVGETSDETLPVAAPPLVSLPAAAKQGAKSVTLDAPSVWQRLAPYVAVVYLLGVLAMLVRLSVALGGGQRLRRSSAPVRDKPLLQMLAAKTAELRLRAAPAVAQCERIAVPIIVGVIKPTILLPVSLLSELSPAQVEAVLTHELAHIRRWDHVANLIQRIVESLLFFHPAVWYVSRCVSRERENCCDDLVIANGTQATCYAELLVRVSELAQKRPGPSPATLAASGDKPTRLRQRILRLLDQTKCTPIRVSRTGFALAAMAVLVAIAVSIYFRAHAADSSKDDSNDFVRAHILYLSDDTEHYRKIEVGSTGRTYKTLLGFFPDVGERKPGGDEAGWSAPLIIELERRDKTRHHVTCDLSQFWNEGNGDHRLDDAYRLRKFLKETYYAGRYTTWVEFIGDGWIELQAVCRAPFGRDRWWGPDGIGCGFNPDAPERDPRAGEYMICIRDNTARGARMYQVPDALVVNSHERPDSTLIQFQPADKLAETATLRYGIANGPWQTVLRTAQPGKFEHELGAVEITSVKIDGTRGSISALMPLAFNRLNWDIVAIDSQGKAHHNDGEDATDVDQPNVVLEEYKFESDGENIKHFELRTRPFRFVEFQNIRLRPRDEEQANAAVVHRADFGRSGNYRTSGVPKLGEVRQVFDHASENTARFVVADDVAYFAGTDAEKKGHVWAVSYKTGKELWSVATPGDRFVFTAPLVQDGRVYFGGPDGKFHCVDAKMGAIQWATQFDRPIEAAPVAVGGMIVVSADGKGFGVEAMTGEVRWKSVGCHYAPVTLVGDIAILLGCDGLRAVDVATGEIKWKGDGISGPAETPCDVAVADGRIYVCTFRRAGDGTQNLRRDLIAFSAKDGKRLWRSEGEPEPIWELAPEPVGQSSGIAISGDLVVHNSYGGFVYAIDAHTGKRIWHRDFMRPLSTPPSIGGATVYFASYNGMVTALDLATGKTLWEHQIADRVHTAPIVIDGGLLVMDRQARLNQLTAEVPRNGAGNKGQPGTQAAKIAAGKLEELWGEPKDGMQAMLIVGQRDWPVGDTPALTAMIRNRGENEFLEVAQAQQLCELEVDGRWYQWVGTIRVRSSYFPPGKTFKDIPVALDGNWHDNETDKPLALEPGRHTVRLAFPITVRETGRGGAKGFRVVSNPVEVRILAAETRAAGNNTVWGPLIERQLTHDVDEASAYLNLKSGKHVKPASWNLRAIKDEFQKAGVDLFHSPFQSNGDQCLCRDMDVVEVKDGWKLTADPVEKTLEDARRQGKSNRNMAPVGTFLDPNVTYVFETRDGSRGVLELVPKDGSPADVLTIRYKLVTGARTEEPSASSQEHAPSVDSPTDGSGNARFVAESISLEVWKRLANEAAAWGEAVEGLRCRWLPADRAVADGRFVVRVVVKNVSDKPVYWECSSGVTWGVQRSTEGGLWTMPKFTATPIAGGRAALASEVKEHFGIGFPKLNDDDPTLNYFLLPPRAGLTLEAELPWPLDKAGKSTINTQLARRNPRTNRFLEQHKWLRCPPLEIEPEVERSIGHERVGVETETWIGDWDIDVAVCTIDFESGIMLTIPKAQRGAADPDDKTVWKWFSDNGLDVAGDYGVGLVGLNMAVAQVSDEQFDKLTLEAAVRRLLPIKDPPNRSAMRLVEREGESSTFLFRTREGSIGLVQITGVDHKNRRQRIRYKLLQISDAPKQANATIGEAVSKKLIGTWGGGGLVMIRLIFRADGTFEQSYDMPPNDPDEKPESGTWTFDGKTLVREITKSEDKDRIGFKLTRQVVQFDDDGLRLKTEDGGFTTYHRARVFHGWTLLKFYSKTDSSKLPDLWEERPAGSKSYEIRRDVKVVYQGIDGTVYHRPDKKVFYIQNDPIGCSTLTFYGPYEGDPRELLSLPEGEAAKVQGQ